MMNLPPLACCYALDLEEDYIMQHRSMRSPWDLRRRRRCFLGFALGRNICNAVRCVLCSADHILTATSSGARRRVVNMSMQLARARYRSFTLPPTDARPLPFCTVSAVPIGWYDTVGECFSVHWRPLGTHYCPIMRYQTNRYTLHLHVFLPSPPPRHASPFNSSKS